MRVQDHGANSVPNNEWTPENDLTTPTLKIKRAKIDEEFSKNYDSWYNSEEIIIWE